MGVYKQVGYIPVFFSVAIPVGKRHRWGRTMTMTLFMLEFHLSCTVNSGKTVG